MVRILHKLWTPVSHCKGFGQSSLLTGSRGFSTSKVVDEQHSYRVVVVGGGAGGCSMAAKFSRKLGAGKVAIIEPCDTHYYQPMWTLVGGGVKTLQQSARPMAAVLPKEAKWIQDEAVEFHPQSNKVLTRKGHEISYDFLIVALGIQLDYHLVKGLPEALETPGVCSNFSPKHVTKTFPAIQNFRGGNAIFTFPNTPIKCAGAPQKIMYLAEHYFRRAQIRDQATVMYFTSLPVIFGVKKYAAALEKMAKRKNIQTFYRHNLTEVRPDKKEVVFSKLDQPKETMTVQYDLLHVTPPMGPPDAIRKCPLSDSIGWIDVDKFSLQHKKYPNVFGIGDCTNAPTSKTAAAVAGQAGVVYHNLSSVMEGKAIQSEYNGYTSCPLITGYGHCILAEFDYDVQPLETLPIDQSKERRITYYMKKDLMPEIYWRLMLRGNWNGPGWIRKAAHLGMSK